MRKIPTIFLREEHRDGPRLTQRLTSNWNPECLWVRKGEGVATRKYDGICTMFDGAHWWARREVKKGKPIPEGYLAVDLDPVTEKTMGWEPIENSSFHKFHAEALFHSNLDLQVPETGTYELVGPKINQNPERLVNHELWPHGDATVIEIGYTRTFEHLWQLCAGMHQTNGWEGIVFHHPDGRMGKIKWRDFRGLEWMNE